MYILLLIIIYAAFVGLGLPDSLLGSAWPIVRTDFSVPLSYMGIISMIICGGTIVSSLFSEHLTKKFGTRIVVVVSTFMTAAALYGFSLTTEFYQLCLWGIPYGLGAGAIDAALNNYVAQYYNSRHMSWLHCFWGLGTIISPYIMSYALVHFNWMTGYRTVAYLQLVIAVILLAALPVWKVNQPKEPEKKDTKVLGIRGVMQIKGVPYLLIAFFAYCAAESTIMLWASSYMEGMRGAGKEEAAALGSLFFIGITAGRFLAGFFTERLGDDTMICLGFAVTLAGILCIMIPVEIVNVAGFIIFGIGCAPIYPCVIHFTPLKFGAEKAQGIIGIQMASAYVGSTFMPPVFGLLAQYISLGLMPVYVAFFMILMICMLQKMDKSRVEQRGE